VRAGAIAMRTRAEHQLALLQSSSGRLDERAREMARRVVAERESLLNQLDVAGEIESAGQRIRCHGDYHLSQVLVNEGDIVILDFEGEPARPMAERRAKDSPLRDIAGMLRSFSYAVLTALSAATKARPDDVERLSPWAEIWEAAVKTAFLDAYFAATRDGAFLPSRMEDAEVMLRTRQVDKAFYELGYELDNRPDWVHIPLAGLLRLTGDRRRIHLLRST